MFLDEHDFESRFMFNPDIKDEADYSHIDKNLSVTKLTSRFKEPEQARSILRALHVLNNNKYFRDVVVEVQTGETEVKDFYFYRCPTCNNTFHNEQGGAEECCGSSIEPEVIQQEVPIMEKVVKKQSLYPRTYHNLKARFYALTTTSMARDGHLIRSVNTRNINENQSVENRTRAKGNPFNFVRKNNNEEY